MGSWSPGPARGAAHISGTLETPAEPRPGRQACWQVEPWKQATAGELVALSKVLQEVGRRKQRRGRTLVMHKNARANGCP